MTHHPEALLPGGGGSYRPPALEPSRTEDARAGYGLPATQARAAKLYLAQLQRIGAKTFATQAFGPFATSARKKAACDWLTQQVPALLTSLPDAAPVLARLLDGRLLDAVVLLGATAPSPVNERPYVAPALPALSVPARAKAYTTPIPRGPANREPLLSVTSDNVCTLTFALLLKAGIPRLGAAVHLVVPIYRGGQWYLDTKPKPGAGRNLPANREASVRFRVPPIPKTHFQQQAAKLSDTQQRGRPIVANTNTLVRTLYFRLGPAHPSHEGYYELLPVRGAVHHS